MMHGEYRTWLYLAVILLGLSAVVTAAQIDAAGVSYAGVGDWRVEMEMDSGQRMPFRVSRRMVLEDLAYESSGIAHIEDWTSPILFISGDDDRSAAMWPTIEMTLALRKRDVPVDTLILPGEAHSFLLYETRQKMLERVHGFLERHLQQATSTTSQAY